MTEKPVVLCVDDEKIILISLQEQLYNDFKENFDIMTAESGEEALDIIDELMAENIEIPVIITDQIMPGIKGDELLAQVHKISPQTRSIMLTGQADAQAIGNALNHANLFRYITKPWDRLDFIMTLKKAIESYDQAKSLESQHIKLFELNEELRAVNNSLEETVSQRTEELKKTYEEIGKDKEELAKRNAIMERELEMARKIQLKLIPQKSPWPNISFIYKSMEKVGGDFFDIITYDDPDIIGIFVSDVSGHGVAAAFITTMLKTLITQFREEEKSPSEILSVLNYTLLRNTDGNFITAFYGTFNRKTREFTYCNAGHNPPYLVSRNHLEMINNEKGSMPLGVMDNHELKVLNKNFTDQSFILNEGDKLILYTDGLTEAINVNAAQDKLADCFEDTVMQEAIKELKDLPADIFVKQMYDKLIAFRGCPVFEDDVCIICVHV